MITVYQASLDNNYKVYVMGSPDTVLSECVEYISSKGERKPIIDNH